MSLIPILFRDNFMDDFLRPSILEKSLFEDEFPSNLFVVRTPISRGLKRRCPCASESQEIKPAQKKSKGHFEVSIDVQNFKPEEISVKMVDNFITVTGSAFYHYAAPLSVERFDTSSLDKNHPPVTVEGKHEEKEDEHGFVSRHFVRKYLLPEGHDLDKVASSLSSDGVLTVKAPRLALPEAPAKERMIPVVQTGGAVKRKSDENNCEKEKQPESKARSKDKK